MSNQTTTPDMTINKFVFPENNVAWIENYRGEQIAFFPEDTSKQDRNIIKNSGEAFALIELFVSEVMAGRLKPKAMVKQFQQLLDKTYE